MTQEQRNTFQQKTFLNCMIQAKAFRDSNLLTDIALECKGQLFETHKVILAANSPFFKNHFNPDKSLKTINIDFTTPEVLEKILDYFYSGSTDTGNVDEEESKKLLKSIMEASSKLQTSLLSNYCLESVLKKASSDISLSDWKFVKGLGIKESFDLFLEIIIKKLASVNNTRDFLKLQLTEVNELFQCSATKECDQNVVLQSILNWINHDSSERKKYTTTFLERFVDFEKVSLAFFCLQFQNVPLLRDNIHFLTAFCKETCKNVNNMQSSSVPESPQEELLNDQHICSFKIDPMEKSKFFIYDSEKKLESESHICEYDFSNDLLTTMIAHPLLSRVDTTLLVHDDKIYAFGGKSMDDKLVHSNVYCYDMKTERWVTMKNMPKEKHGSSAIWLNGFIYILGGKSGKFLKSVERYDPAKEEWETLTELPADYHQTVPVATVQDILFVMLKSKMYKYIPQENKWDCLNDEVTKDLNITGDVHICRGNDRIYIIEKKAPTCVWIYEPTDDNVDKDLIPKELNECDGIMNLENAGDLAFLVTGSGLWFIYRPDFNSWKEITSNSKRLKEFKFPMLNLLSF